MIYSSEDPEAFLVEISDLDHHPPPAEIADVLPALRTIVAWARDYLSVPHSELGREGPVCPFVPKALEFQTFYLAVRRGNDFDREALEASILRCRDWFLALKPNRGPERVYKTILNLFPDLEPSRWVEVIDGTQERLKPRFVPQGLMIGEFHSIPPSKAGLWNPDFRPLQAPVPMLAIRHLVPTDFWFLRHERGLVEEYLRLFGDNLNPRVAGAVREAAERFGLELPAQVNGAREMAAREVVVAR